MLGFTLGGCTATAPTPPTPSPPTRALVDKVLIVVLENHSLDETIAAMPYLRDLSQYFAYAADYSAVAHPSLPNYLAIAGGSTFDVVDDGDPSVHPIHGASVFGQAIAAGGTAALYAEGMTTSCESVSDGRYAVRHNPWAYFVDEGDLCRKFDVSLDHLAADIDAGSLPNVGMVVPDVCNDGHDCPLTTTDDWYRDLLPSVLAGPDFQSGRLVVVLTADEDDREHENRVLTVVLRLGGDVGAVSQPLTHYSLSRLCSEVSGASALRDAAEAPSMADAFGIP
jgi:acid phosphatase